MTMKEWANRLNGREYRNELTREEAVQAKKDGIVIAYGHSDDLLELEGFIDKEVTAYDGVDFGFVKAIWCPENKDEASWLIESILPYENFDIVCEGELYCIGAVISVSPQDENKEFYKLLLEEGFSNISNIIMDGKNKIMRKEVLDSLLEDLTDRETIEVLKRLKELRSEE